MSTLMPTLSESDTKQLTKDFQTFDRDRDGRIDATEMTSILQKLSLFKSKEQVKNLIAEVDSSGDGTIDLAEFTDCVLAVKNGLDSGFAKVYSANVVRHRTASGLHSFSNEEMAAFATHLTAYLERDPDLAHLMPIQPDSHDLLTKTKDGLLLCKFINIAQPDTLDERALNKPKGNRPLSVFEIGENNALCISSAKSIGVQTTNVGSTEITNGVRYPHLVLGLVWQLVKIHSLSQLNLKAHPELVRLLEEDEELEDLMKLPAEQLLLRWFNYHLKNAAFPTKVTAFDKQLSDSRAYLTLLNQISPDVVPKTALNEPDAKKRAASVLRYAKLLNVKVVITPDDLLSGNPRLHLAFTAAIFNECPGLDKLTEEEFEQAGLMEDDEGDSREERAFRLWINSLNLEGVQLHNLYENLSDGIVLLKVLELIEPELVSWNRVEMKPTNKYKKVANCNYGLLLGKQLKFSLVGIGGPDIVDQNKKLLLAFVWQIMRLHSLRTIAALQASRFGDQAITDSVLIKWANDTVASQGRETRISSMRDPSLKNGLFFMDLLYAIEHRVINWDYVTAGETEEDMLLNAKYAISVARKLGAVMFVLPEDLMECRPKMVFSFIASVAAIKKPSRK